MSYSVSLLICLLLPALSVLAGALVVRFWQPTSVTLAAVQHFTAGLVLSAVAVELMGDLVSTPHFVAVVTGFVVGVLFMLAIGKITQRAESSQEQVGGSSGLIFAVGVALFVDGLLVGTALTLGAKRGVLIALALTIEAFFLALSTCSTLRTRRAGRREMLLVPFLLAVLVVTGVLTARFFSVQLDGALLVGTLSFATAALLYLVVEELLVEAHQGEDRGITPAFFFAGFLLLYVLQHWLGD